MPYEVTCPKGHRLQVTESHFGERVSCPTCGEAFVVPNLGKAQAANFPPLPGSKPSAESRPWKAPFAAVSDFKRLPVWTGRPLVAVGLILVLFSRGCDVISQRNIARTAEKMASAVADFKETWEGKQLDIERAIKLERDKNEPDQKKLESLDNDLKETRKKKDKAEEENQTRAWRSLKIGAREADSAYRINGYWRELFFVFSTITLAMGLLVVSWTAEGAERWVTLIMLAIITFSVFIGGIAWIPMTGLVR
jgi:hypothetical protein